MSSRLAQKQRTREAVVEATRALLAQGITPTVEQAAESAQVSRPTAYRYFPNQHALLAAAHPELGMDSLLPRPAPDDVLQRLDLMSAHLLRLLLEHETALRAMYRIDASKAGQSQPPPALRTGKRILWVEDALAPLRKKLGAKRFRRLVLQIGATLGIEPLIWLIDVAHVERNEATEILRASARELLKGAL